ncbi:MAG TPA: hypothetical protein PK185_16095 [Cyclobacteriaceae bacterium]|nr:hypothetical protein [Cyclobacteriaceae bacterium]
MKLLILKSITQFLFIVLFGVAVAQTPEQQAAPIGFMSKNLVIPPSPEAASLGQYGNVPVSLYTGKTNVSIPIYELRGKEITLPISLSYNSGGFKVGEVPGWTGLGWTLNAGGVVTRSVLGRPDDCTYFYNKSSEIYQNIAFLNPIERQEFYEEISKGYIETEPDIYFYNFAGNSGKFFIDAYKDITLEDYKPISLSISNICSNESVFTAKGPDGTTYIFEDREITDLLYDDEGLISTLDHYVYTSSWYLTQMISANKIDTIYFDYAVGSAAPLNNSNIMSEHMSYTTHGPTSSGGGGSSPPCGSISGPSFAGISTTSISTIYLTSIRLNEKEILFSSSISGSSISGRKLNSITVNHDNSQIKKFIFDYTFFDGPDLNDDRLRLDKIYEYGPLGLVAPPYKFEYSSAVLPSINSKAIDHWGYYNGSGDGSLIPTFVEGNCTRGGGANREPNASYVEACMLNKITYPTGGSTVFDYGIHKSGEPPYIKSVIIYDDNLTSTLLGGGVMASGTCQGSPKYDIKNITVPTGIDGVEFSTPGLIWDEQEHGEGVIAFAGLIKASEYTNSSCNIFSWAENNISKFEYYWFLDYQGSSATIPTMVDPGDYKLIVVNEIVGEYISIGFNYITHHTGEIVVHPPDKLIGGVRIEKITDYSADGIIASIKEYDYNGSPITLQGNSYTYQSGLSFGEPQYDYTTSHFFKAPYAQEESGSYIIDYTSYTYNLVASSRSSLGTVLGSHVGYSKVTERFKDPSGESNGSKVYYYRNNELPTVSYPFSHGLNEYGQGDLLNEQIFDRNGNLVAETINEYAYDVNETRHNKTIHGIKVFPDSYQSNQLKLVETNVPNEYIWIASYNLAYYQTYGNLSNPLHSKDFKVINNISSYSSYARWQYLAKTTKNEYRNGQVFTSYTKNFYDNQTHAQVSRQETKNSKGEIFISKLRYPGDGITDLSTNANLAKSKLVSNHVYDKVLERIELNGNSEVIASQKVHFELVNNNPFPKEVYYLKTTGPISEGSLATNYEKRASYNYNEFGDLLDYSKENDLKQGYVWSSDHEFAIAEVTGADSNAIGYTSFEGDSNEGNFTFVSNTSSDSKTGKNSHALSGSNIVKLGLQSNLQYELSFWAKGSSPSVSNVVASYDNPYTGSDGWKFYKKIISATNQITVSGSALIDEIRLHPLGAQMTTYVYEPGYGIVQTIDPNGMITQFEYYNTGRLKQIKDFDGNILKNYKYHYQTN